MTADSLNGAESLVHTLLGSGVDTCFANPGTSEMHFVAALDRIPGMRCILCLFEGGVTGAADGYGRMADRPAATLLHCAPGLANGLANLHNAQKARTPIVNIVGDHATYHGQLDPPLANDTEGFARPVSIWTRTTRRPERVGADAAEAVAAALSGARGIATLILPSDSSWTAGGIIGAARPPVARASVPEAAVATAATLLRRPGAALLLDGPALRADGLALAHAIAVATGCRLLSPTSVARMTRGQGLPVVTRIPYVVETALAALADLDAMVLAGATAPVTFFAYPGRPGVPQPPGCTLHTLSRPEQDSLDALRRLADHLGARPQPVLDQPRPEPAIGAVTGAAFAQSLAALMPDDAVIVDEAITFGPLHAGTAGAPRHDWLNITGGAIGIGIPLATGAAVGAPGRRVIDVQADGSALYTLQSLWTQARERLDVTTVILANRAYAILQGEYANVGAVMGDTARAMMDLTDPVIDWVTLANGFGVEAARADTMERLNDLMAAANRRTGPFLIELTTG